MADLSFRSALFQKDRHTCQNIISYKITGPQLVQFLNDLIFASVSTIKNPAAGIHPVCVINSIKNFVSDDRDHPSKVLLEFAVNYLFKYDFRKNDQSILDETLQDGIGQTAFLGDLENACQSGTWNEAESLAAKIFLASDQSRGTMDALTELALQDVDRNSLFVFHILRAYHFQELKKDTWVFTKCLLDQLAGDELKDAHVPEDQNPEEIWEAMIKWGDIPLFSAIERLWKGDYVRIRGYQRELSYWVSQFTMVEKEEIKPSPSHWLTDHDSTKFISCAERIVMNEKTQKEKVTELVTLEAVRSLSKNANEQQIGILASRLNQLLS